MRRAEIIANNSVLDEIIEALENSIPGFLYTVIPVVHGKGKENKKLGTVTWPELNFVMIAYVEDADVAAVRAAVASIKGRFPNEGTKLFILPGAES
jgi:hydrophobic/amphiphilic exporter-1 (mainly G- bacteria), HAE1 family